MHISRYLIPLLFALSACEERVGTTYGGPEQPRSFPSPTIVLPSPIQPRPTTRSYQPPPNPTEILRRPPLITATMDDISRILNQMLRKEIVIDQLEPDLVGQIFDSTVIIAISTPTKTGRCNGVIIAPSIIVSASHCLLGSDKNSEPMSIVIGGGGRYDGMKIESIRPVKKADAFFATFTTSNGKQKIKPVKIGDLYSLRIGDPLHFLNKDPKFGSGDYSVGVYLGAFGENSLGLSPVDTNGVPYDPKDPTIRNLIMAIAAKPLGPGTSGSGVYNRKGELIGGTSASSDIHMSVIVADAQGNEVNAGLQVPVILITGTPALK